MTTKLLAGLRTINRYLPQPSCIFCLTRHARDGCCEACRRDLPHIKRACRLCGIPLNWEKQWLDICADCLKQQHEPIIMETLSAYHYAIPLRKSLHYLKFSYQQFYAPVMGQLWLEAWQSKDIAFKPDLLIPVPLHINRLRQRGFNQTLELAKPLARHLGLPLARHICYRARDTRPQMELPRTERTANIKGAFAVTQAKSEIRHKSIIILDDVMTSGATVKELAKLLKKHGAARIAVWTLMRSS